MIAYMVRAKSLMRLPTSWAEEGPEVKRRCLSYGVVHWELLFSQLPGQAMNVLRSEIGKRFAAQRLSSTSKERKKVDR